MTPGITQIVVIVLLFMVLFGYKRIPAMMENFAKGINSFKKGLKEEEAKEAGEKPKSLSDDTVLETTAVEDTPEKAEHKE